MPVTWLSMAINRAAQQLLALERPLVLCMRPQLHTVDLYNAMLAQVLARRPDVGAGKPVGRVYRCCIVHIVVLAPLLPISIDVERPGMGGCAPAWL